MTAALRVSLLSFALLALPCLASATEVHLLDEASLVPAVSVSTIDDAPVLQLGLARPSAGPAHAIVGGLASWCVPGLGQCILGYPGRGLLFVAGLGALLVIAVVIAAGTFQSVGGVPSFSAAGATGLQVVGLGFSLLGIGAAVDAVLLGMNTDRFGAGG